MGNRGHILVADDDPDFVVLLQVALKKAGIHNPVHTVNTGLKGVDYLKGAGVYADRVTYPMPHLALIDVGLPVRNGFDVLRWIKGQPDLRSLIVAMLSGSGFESEAELAYEMGANTFLAKPCRFHTLVEMLEQHRDSWFPPMRPRSHRKTRAEIITAMEQRRPRPGRRARPAPSGSSRQSQLARTEL